jgi:hypothetical protein
LSVMIPTSRPSASMTGSPLTWRSAINFAAA